MLTVDQYDYIRTAHRVDGKTIRQIARDIGHSKNRVKKALQSQFVSYPARARQPYPVLGPYLTNIDKWLKADKETPKKQRHTAKRIYHRLRFEQSALCRFLKKDGNDSESALSRNRVWRFFGNRIFPETGFDQYCL